jgi:hypothetical protein
MTGALALLQGVLDNPIPKVLYLRLGYAAIFGVYALYGLYLLGRMRRARN